MVAKGIRVTGKVQGVFFRAWAAEEARKGRVSGWIRNCPDGSVEAHLEGELNDVRWLIDKLAYGPPGARVDKCDVRDAEPEDFSGFEVRH